MDIQGHRNCRSSHCKMLEMTNVTGDRGQAIAFKDLRCPTALIGEIHQHLIYLSAFNIFFSVTAFIGNTLILVALGKESSLHPPSKLLLRCLATTDLCVGFIVEPLNVAYLMSLVHEDWHLCRFLEAISFIAGYSLASVSLLTLTSISVDRLLTLLLGSRYRQVVTLKRTYLIIATFWVLSSVAAALYLKSHILSFWYSRTMISACLIISVISYAKIFVTLRRHRIQVRNNTQQQNPSHYFSLNMARYRKAVYSALWVKLALVVCYLPYSVITVLISNSRPSSLYFLVWVTTVTLVYFNSSLNPFLYCWKIREVRRAVKETIRQALCYSWS